jgi:hypothetical protein
VAVAWFTAEAQNGLPERYGWRLLACQTSVRSRDGLYDCWCWKYLPWCEVRRVPDRAVYWRGRDGSCVARAA